MSKGGGGIVTESRRRESPRQEEYMETVKEGHLTYAVGDETGVTLVPNPDGCLHWEHTYIHTHIVKQGTLR